MTSLDLLAGVVHVGDDLTNTIFRNAGVSLDAIKDEIEAIKPSVTSPRTVNEVAIVNDAQRVVRFADDEADRMLHTFQLEHFRSCEDRIGPEHLLLGISRADNTTAAAILVRHGVTLEPARVLIYQALASHALGGAMSVRRSAS